MGSGEGWRRWVRWAPAWYSGLLAVVIAGPLLGPGYLLLRDAVSTPRSYLTDSALGLGDAAPRAVPQDAVLAMLSPVLDGGLVVKAILLVALWAAGWGAAVLSRELLRVPVGPQVVASTVAMWNPYVAERLLQGHWSLLAGYAALPWTALAAYRIRTSRTAAGWAALAACFAAAGLTPTGALLAGALALLTVGRRQLPGALALLALASAPWLAATFLSGAGAEPSDPAGIAAFAARAEPGLGTLASLAGLGGIWNADAVPDSRTTLFAAVATGLLLAVVATGIRRVATSGSPGHDHTTAVSSAEITDRIRRVAISGFPHRTDNRNTSTTGSPAHTAHENHTTTTGSAETGGLPATATTVSPERVGLLIRRTLLGLAVAAVVLPALGATPAGRDLLEWLVTQVPGAGLLRDTQKYVALAMPAYALCAAAGCHSFAARFSAATPSSQSSVATTGTLGAALDATPGQPAAESNRPDNPPIAPEESRELPGRTTIESSNPSITPEEPPELPSRTTIESSRSHGPSSTPQDPPRIQGRTASASTAESNTGAVGSAGQPGHADNSASTGPRTGILALTTAIFAALLILPLPDLAWGVGGALRPVHYPIGWQHVAERIDGPGDVAVLPAGMFRKFPYSGSAPVLDPAPRLLPRDVLQTGELPVQGRTVSGEGARAKTVETALLQGGSPRELAALGVGWVLLERTTPGPLGESKTTLAQLNPVYSDTQLTLYQVTGVTATPHRAHRHIAAAAHFLWAATLLIGLLIAARPTKTSTARAHPRH